MAPLRLLCANHHAPLKSSAADPTAGGSAEETLQGYQLAGVPAGKLNLGVPFYGRGWARVSNANDGLYQLAGGVPRGTYEKGVDDFKALEAKDYTGYWDEEAEAYWIYNGRTFWSYDNAASATNKATYAKTNNLSGVFFWELSGDDTSGTLIHAINDGLQ
jgi:chitinase